MYFSWIALAHVECLAEVSLWMGDHLQTKQTRESCVWHLPSAQPMFTLRREVMLFRDVHNFLLLFFSLPDEARKADLLNHIPIKIPDIQGLTSVKWTAQCVTHPTSRMKTSPDLQLVWSISTTTAMHSQKQVDFETVISRHVARWSSRVRTC